MKDEIFDGFPADSTLRECTRAGCEALEVYWTEASYPARAVIVGEDEDDDDVFFILQGRARAATYTNNGKEVMLADLSCGESFGIFAAIDGGKRSVDVVALEPCRIARMSGAQFNQVLEEDTRVMRAFLKYLVGRLRALSSMMRQITTMNAEQRLIHELLRLAQERDDGTATINPLPTQQELATVIFSQRESVGRDMSELKRAGLISRNGRSLTINNLSALEARLSH